MAPCTNTTYPSGRAPPFPPWASESTVSSSSAPLRGRSARVVTAAMQRGWQRRYQLSELRLNRVEHRLPVRVALLVVAHLAQLRRREAVETALHLRGGQLVV